MSLVISCMIYNVCKYLDLSVLSCETHHPKIPSGSSFPSSCYYLQRSIYGLELMMSIFCQELAVGLSVENSMAFVD